MTIRRFDVLCHIAQRPKPVARTLVRSAIGTTASVMLALISVMSASAQTVTKPASDPEHIRGQIEETNSSWITVKTHEGSSVRVQVPENVGIFRLSEASFSDVDFGTYVGAVSKRLDEYSPIVRDSLSWLHLAYELRILDENLRGLALGHQEWDLTQESVMSHGWVDDLEVRILSIKYGPTEEEETDVDVPRDVPVTKMSLGDRNLIRPGANVFAGAQPDRTGEYSAVFLIVGEDGIVPTL